jgi:hypothetical protein
MKSRTADRGTHIAHVHNQIPAADLLAILRSGRWHPRPPGAKMTSWTQTSIRGPDLPQIS